MLKFIEVQKSYGRRQVLSIPSLQLNKGIYWLQGPNGSGKSTLLRMVAGLLPFKGEIDLDGLSLRRNPVAYRRSVSWSDAEPLYPAYLTGQDLISFYRDIRKASQAQVDELMTVFGVRSYCAAPIGTWSSGMIKKLSLLLAFIGRPSLITLDEPLVTLDNDAIPAFYTLVRAVRQQYDTSFLISSHHDLETNSLPIEKKLAVSGQTIV
jgi:ABC-2 type transport system ATP-binding protein